MVNILNYLKNKFKNRIFDKEEPVYKLVRDKVVDSLILEGKHVEFRELSHNQYIIALKAKLCEDVDCLKNVSSCQKEEETLAEIFEIVDLLKHSLKENNCPSLQKIVETQHRKKELEGAFDKKYFLIKIC